MGLKNPDKDIIGYYSSNNAGCSNIIGRRDIDNDAIEEKVHILNATNVLNEIALENVERNLIVKMDCEGSEYQILKKWFDDTMLPRISILMLEWHIFNRQWIPTYYSTT